MLKICPLVALLLALPCRADDMLRAGVTWLKESLPSGTQVDFNKSNIRFDGCNHKEYLLSLTQPVTEHFVLKGDISRASGNIEFGVFEQNIRLTRWSIVPTLQTSENLSFGAGVMFQSAPEFRASNGFSVDLPESRMMLVETRFQDNSGRHNFMLRLSSHQWQASSAAGNWFERGEADNKITFGYQASF